MKDNNRNDQIERFFQHNPIEDPLYLKKYVKEHPDHKMAWYLLGREYAAQGKEGKAAYCFAQSGGIYEAFERQKIAVEGPLPAFPSSAMQGTEEALMKKGAAANKSGLKRVSRRLALIIMLILIAIPASIEVAKVGESPSQAGNKNVLNVQTDAAIAPSINTSSKQKLYFAESGWGSLLQKVISSSGSGTGESIIMEASKSTDGKWVEWNKAVKPIIGVENGGGSGNTGSLKYYNPQVCSCQAADSSALIPVIHTWMLDREQAIVLQSAIQAYREKTGALPDQPEQLAKAYPDNLLPGLSPEMQAMFPQALSKVKEMSKAGDGGGGQESNETKKRNPEAKDQSAPSNAQPTAAAEPLVEPLRIIIDTEKHRLALISGKYVIRSYPVGLGGGKTPEGDFVITEKVRNPNGKSNGEFGSRGMTLSDSLYAIHGTNNPASIGKDESHGCVRMLQADVEELYDMVPGMTKVTIGKGTLPDSDEGGGKEGEGNGAGRGNPGQSFHLPLQTTDSNPNKKYKWLD
ncbi:L,D-transpeptidase family protein [Paenibacillus sp. SI8]|uniref:L,D-transpeptidase family protein n=1 Tax=unclassified Paenibacillus TaxID=185978 RepID=UPI0034650769